MVKKFLVRLEKMIMRFLFQEKNKSPLPCLPGEALAKPGSACRSQRRRQVYRRVSPYSFLNTNKFFIMNDPSIHFVAFLQKASKTLRASGLGLRTSPVGVCCIVGCLLCVSNMAFADAPASTATVPENNGLELTRDKSVQRALPLVLGLVGEKPSAVLTDFGKYLARDLGYSEQCAVTIRHYKEMQKKETMQALHKEGIVLAIFVQEMGKNIFEVRLYDTTHVTMLMGKRFSFTQDCPRVWAHTIADVLWPVLTGQQGMFSTKIAYCKKASKKNAKIKHVFIADYDGSNQQLIVGTPTVNIAPRWNNDAQRPLLFYSEYTNENVRLAAVNMNKQRKIVSNFDGINMVPSFSQDGKTVVYCASRGKGSCQLFMHSDGKLKQLTHNTGNNVSPCFSRDGSNIYYCSDYESGQPQIYTYSLKDGSMERITDGGYCASPSCSTRHEKIAYAKIIDGIMQVMLYDPAKKTHTQLTFGPGNKEECSWSPCGNYLLFSQEEGAKSAIVSLHMQTKRTKVLTASREVCSYPAWSPVYAKLPYVAA